MIRDETPWDGFSKADAYEGARACRLCARFSEHGHAPDCPFSELTKLREQLVARQTRIERLKVQLRARGWAPLEPGHNLREQLAAAVERSAHEAARADMLHAALNTIVTQRAAQGWHSEDADLEADEALRLSRTRRAALLVQCSCGEAYGLEEWIGLRGLGLQEQAGLPGDPLELRLCVNCGTTLALPLRRLPVTK